MSKTYKIVAGGMHDRFMQSRKKVQLIGGGFGNGKTAAVCVKALSLSRDYPGSNGLIARSTYPKLNDTIRKEFISWCPSKWISRRPTKDDNTLYLTNGTVVNFRYVQQQGKGGEQSTSNLLSATYDWIIVDQIEDPEFQHKDFMDLLGRLRGSADYIGNDPTMPKSGPRWMMLTTNPTRNWVYRELVRPLHRFMEYNSVVDPKLLVEVDNEGKPIIIDGRPQPLIELFEGSTYENVDNVGEDYIKGMLSSFTGTMRERFVMGKWGALSGLIYPIFDETIHGLPEVDIKEYMNQLHRSGFQPTWIEAYDHGLAVESCYLLAFADDDGNVFVVDGFYEREQPIATSARRIHETRAKWGLDGSDILGNYADPDLFRRKASSNSAIVGSTIAELYENEHGIRLRRGDSNISAGIAKVTDYLTIANRHEHPLTGQRGSPHLFISNMLGFVIDEFNEYHWQQNTSGDYIDSPMDKKDHAMDAIKYLLTDRPKLAIFRGRPDAPKMYMKWHEIERQTGTQVLPRHR